MLFSASLVKAQRILKTSYRPVFDVLEDRTVPTALFRNVPLPVSPLAPPTHFQVIAPSVVQSGQLIDVMIEAEDANNRMVTNYKGTIHLTLGLMDANVSLPSSYSFTAGDHGKHTFHLALVREGNQTIHVMDTHSSFGMAVIMVHAGQSATHFAVVAPTTVSAGMPTLVTVQALDAANHTVLGYTGTVHFTSTDGNALLPTDYTFLTTDNGTKTFYVTNMTPGQQILTVSDLSSSVNGFLKGNASVTVISTASNPLVNGWIWNPYLSYNPYWSWNNLWAGNWHEHWSPW